jgi:hypothetical protein
MQSSGCGGDVVARPRPLVCTAAAMVSSYRRAEGCRYWLLAVLETERQQQDSFQVSGVRQRVYFHSGISRLP